MRGEFQKILVIAGSGIGNILLATPLIRSLRRAFPEAVIDVLVPQGRGEILNGNPDINSMLEVVRHQGLVKSLAFLRRIWRQYDVVLSAQAGDRSLTNAWLAAPLRCSHVRESSAKRAWVKATIQHCIPADDETHAVVHGLRLLEPLGVERDYGLVAPECSRQEREALDGLLPFSRQAERYMVFHPYPRNRYKCWTAEGWRAVAQRAAAGGYRVVVTGGGGQVEQGYIRSVFENEPTGGVIDLSGKLSLPQVGELLTQAVLYIGPDTGVTHLAAACGTACIALYGPTRPVYWGPWPVDYAKDGSPFENRGGVQRCGNVAVVMAEHDCIACGKEGCSGPGNPSACMELLSADMVLKIMDELIGSAKTVEE